MIDQFVLGAISDQLFVSDHRRVHPEIFQLIYAYCLLMPGLAVFLQAGVEADALLNILRLLLQKLFLHPGLVRRHQDFGDLVHHGLHS